MREAVLVSACLMGVECRYDGTSRPNDFVKTYLAGKQAVPVCPEVDGGLPTPRLPSTLTGGDGFAVLEGRASVLDELGRDVTRQFLAGARVALDKAMEAGARKAVLKERSPSCGLCDARVRGCHVHYGTGVACAMLLDAGILVLNELQVENEMIGQGPGNPPGPSQTR